MANPTVGSWKKLKRVGRYLQGQPRSSTQYAWQGGVEQIQGYSDSDWAGYAIVGGPFRSRPGYTQKENAS